MTKGFSENAYTDEVRERAARAIYYYKYAH